MSRTYHSKKTFKRKMLKIREARERLTSAGPPAIPPADVSRELD